jgi:type IV pilus assembly protein PilA
MLKKMFKLMKKGNKGFSLAELMVVVAIIGVLVAIAIPVYNASTAKAEKGACIANLRMIDGAIQQYRNDKGSEPTDISELASYFLDGVPKCPTEDAAAYELVEIGEHQRAKCSVSGHSYATGSDATPTTVPSE